MVMIPYPWALIHKSEFQFKYRQHRPRVCFSENAVSWRIKAQNIDILGYRLTVLCPCGQVDRQYGQIVWSPFPYPITSHERGGGFSGLVPNHSIYLSGFPNNYFGLDAMNNPSKSISGDTVQPCCCRTSCLAQWVRKTGLTRFMDIQGMPTNRQEGTYF